MTAAQELAQFLGLPSRIEVGDSSLNLQNFQVWIGYDRQTVHIQAKFIRLSARGDGDPEPLVKRYELRELKA